MAGKSSAKTVEEYVTLFSDVPRERIDRMRKLIKEELPASEERISYGIPAYFVERKLIIYFACYKNHIGMYPGRTNSDAYNKLAAKYAHGKSTAQFPHAEPLPEKVIKEYIKTRLKEVRIT